jgi:uncharacterized protein YgiM (DUF1202 family)
MMKRTDGGLTPLGVALVLVLLVFVGHPGEAGDNPFSGGQIMLGTQESGSGATASSLSPVKEGEKIEGTVEVASSLNIRSEPWGDIIGSLGPGAKVTIVGQIGDWYKIQVGGKTAVVHSAYVRRPGEGPKPFPRTGWVNAPQGLNVRRVPHGDVVGTLKDQRQVEILGMVGDFYKIKWGANEAFVAKRYIDADHPSSPGASKITPMNFVGRVNADIGLNVRSSPWGAIDTTLPNRAAVQVTGKIDDWYRISYNGKTRYVHANYIDRGAPPPTQADAGPPGSLQQKIVREARALIGSTRFRGREVDYGNKACAQVVSTALRNAGAMDRVVLNVRSLVSDLRAKGWRDVQAPPFQQGDVITWKTYDYTGDGIKDPDTHVGVMVKEGNSFMAMNNSSRLRTPRLTDPYVIGPVTRVMRKVA